ncbi:hypothetical protein [Roseinatronobacter sp.]|uniref:hypothetical protein n=1 Tax=Roseinatronobacter sp. TaxID=1945755 RepID=UPI0025E6BEC0|nr:hypothetical protein [Rhodobaca sp.]
MDILDHDQPYENFVCAVMIEGKLDKSVQGIIYALKVTGVSVPALFLGGVGPGILLAIALSAYAMLTIRRGH